jgi:hypothetical protein
MWFAKTATKNSQNTTMFAKIAPKLALLTTATNAIRNIAHLIATKGKHRAADIADLCLRIIADSRLLTFIAFHINNLNLVQHETTSSTMHHYHDRSRIALPGKLRQAITHGGGKAD